MRDLDGIECFVKSYESETKDFRSGIEPSANPWILRLGGAAFVVSRWRIFCPWVQRSIRRPSVRWGRLVPSSTCAGPCATRLAEPLPAGSVRVDSHGQLAEV